MAFEELVPGRTLEVCWAEDGLWRSVVVYSFGPRLQNSGDRMLYYPELLEWELLGMPSHANAAMVVGRRPMPHLLAAARAAANPKLNDLEKELVELELWCVCMRGWRAAPSALLQLFVFGYVSTLIVDVDESGSRSVYVSWLGSASGGAAR